jgi:phosphoribosylanthranilate isomerase
MTTPFIKICGITNELDAILAVKLGAHALGLNLYPGSKRFVASAVATKIAAGLPSSVEAFTVVVNEPIENAIRLALPIGRILQWHGDEPPLPPGPPWHFVPAFSVADAGSLQVVKSYCARCAANNRPLRAILLDGHAKDQYGGTGQTAPWHLIADSGIEVPIILAGGLTADNVAEAIRVVRPYGVDVASGVESSPGRKDPEKMRRFIEAVRSA